MHWFHDSGVRGHARWGWAMSNLALAFLRCWFCRSLSEEIKHSKSTAVLDVLTSEDVVLELLESAVESEVVDKVNTEQVKTEEPEEMADKARYMRDLAHRLEGLKTYITRLSEWRNAVAARQQAHSRWLAVRRPTMSAKVTPHALAGVAERAAAASTIQACGCRACLLSRPHRRRRLRLGGGTMSALFWCRLLSVVPRFGSTRRRVIS